MDEILLETISFLDTTVCPSLAQEWRTEQSTTDEQVLPHRLPLKRRLAEFRHGTSIRRGSAANLPAICSSVSNNLWAIERFRDITPALVVAVFDDSLVLEPGDVGPLPLSHPVAKELIRCINGQILTLALLEKLRECGALLYDGCAVVGIVDYRRWAFGTITTSRSPDVGGAKASGSNTMAPEMHKILLKPNFATFQNDIENHCREELGNFDSDLAIEIESRILVSRLFNVPICR